MNLTDDALTLAIDEILAMNLYSDVTARLVGLIENACFDYHNFGYDAGERDGLQEHLDNPTAE